MSDSSFLRAEAEWLREPEYPEAHMALCYGCGCSLYECEDEDCQIPCDHRVDDVCTRCEGEY